MTTKVRVDGIIIETTGEHERLLIESTFSVLAMKYDTPIVSPLSPAEVALIREELTSPTAKEIIDDFSARREAAEEPLNVRSTADEPEYWHTGIKIDDDGTRRYKTYYKCPECESKGRRYVELGTKIITCHTCGTDLQVKPAVPDAPHERDEFGNFMVARERAR